FLHPVLLSQACLTQATFRRQRGEHLRITQPHPWQPLTTWRRCPPPRRRAHGESRPLGKPRSADQQPALPESAALPPRLPADVGRDRRPCNSRAATDIRVRAPFCIKTSPTVSPPPPPPPPANPIASDNRVLFHRQTKLDRLYSAVDPALQKPTDFRLRRAK